MDQSIQEQLLFEEEYENTTINEFREKVIRSIHDLPDAQKTKIENELNLISDLEQLKYFKSSELYAQLKVLE